MVIDPFVIEVVFDCVVFAMELLLFAHIIHCVFRFQFKGREMLSIFGEWFLKGTVSGSFD